MKYIRQFCIILIVSFAGELLHAFLPLPIPTCIYGMLLMLLLLQLKIIKLEDVKPTSTFLIEIMPLMFIPAAVGLMDSWGIIRSNLVAYVVITILSTIIVMLVTGQVTQFVIRLEQKRKARKEDINGSIS